jgi:hypothetical protein
MGNKLTTGKLLKQSYTLELESFLDNKLIKKYLNNFWIDIMNNIQKDQRVLLLFRVRLGDEDDPTVFGYYITIGNLFKINNSKKDFNRLYDLLNYLLSIKDNSYKNLPIKEIVFSYKIIALDNDKISKKSTIGTKKSLKQKIKTYQFKGYNLPNTMDYKFWGKIISITDNNIIIRKKGSKYIYNINIINNNPLTYNVTLELANKDVFLTFIDIQNKNFDSLNYFTRYIGPNEYYFQNGELLLRLNPKKISFLEGINLYKNKFGKKIIPQIDNKFITLDIETQVFNGIIRPILICIYDCLRYYNFYIPDYHSIDDMVNNALNILLNPKYDKYKIYVHNLSNFDGIFLMKYFINLKYLNQDVLVKPTLKDGKMINIDIKFDKYTISFRDSLLTLLASLRKLAKAFNVEDKGTFEYKSVDNLTVEQLNDPLIRKQNIEYAQLDCKILYDILINFNHIIFELFHLNINNYPTLPSLAFGIFRSKYLINNEIPNLTRQKFLDIKESYTGDSTDLIIPNGKNL